MASSFCERAKSLHVYYFASQTSSTVRHVTNASFVSALRSVRLQNLNIKYRLSRIASDLPNSWTISEENAQSRPISERNLYFRNRRRGEFYGNSSSPTPLIGNLSLSEVEGNEDSSLDKDNEAIEREEQVESEEYFLEQGDEEEENETADDDYESEGEDEEDEAERDVGQAKKAQDITVKPRKFPLLGNHEKKELRAYAHSLGKDIIVQQIGKWGVTSTLAEALSNALEANEIMKVRVLDNCPDELVDVIAELESKTDGQVVGKVGRTLVLYRPSLTKLAKGRAQREREQIMKNRKFSSRGGGARAKTPARGGGGSGQRGGGGRRGFST